MTDRAVPAHCGGLGASVGTGWIAEEIAAGRAGRVAGGSVHSAGRLVAADPAWSSRQGTR